MILFYIIAGLVVVGLLLRYFNAKKKNSPYFKTKRQLEDQLKLVNFTGDWQKRQQINLHLLWLETINEEVSTGILEKYKETDKTSRLITLSFEYIKFPLQWELDDLFGYPFTQKIISAYANVLAKNDYKKNSIPDSILPVPKEFIRKAIDFTITFLNLEKPIYEVIDKDEHSDLMNALSYLLDKDLQKKSTIEILNQLFEREQEFKSLGLKFAIEELWDCALACFEQVKEINPESKDIRNIVSLTYLEQGIYHYKKGEKTFAIKNIQKSAELNNEKAIKWLEEH